MPQKTHHTPNRLSCKVEPVCPVIHPNTFRISNPVTLGPWLHEQCSRYGVEFWMNSQAVSADLSSTDEIHSIDVLHDNKTSSTLRCDNLILATGPWTPALFKTLFPGSPVTFEPVISAGEWFVFENPEPHSSVIAATYFDDIVGQKLEFAGRVSQFENNPPRFPRLGGVVFF